MFVRLASKQPLSKPAAISSRVAPLAQAAASDARANFASAARPILVSTSAALPTFALKPVSILAATEAAAVPRRSARPLVFDKTKYISPLAISRQIAHPVPMLSASVFARAMSTEKPQVFDQKFIMLIMDRIELKLFLTNPESHNMRIEQTKQLESSLMMLPAILRLQHQLIDINNRNFEFDYELRTRLQKETNCLEFSVDLTELAERYPNSSVDYKLLGLYVDLYLAIFIPHKMMLEMVTGKNVFNSDAETIKKLESLSFYLNDPINSSAQSYSSNSSSLFSNNTSIDLLLKLGLTAFCLLATGYIIYTLTTNNDKKSADKNDNAERGTPRIGSRS